MRRMKNLTQIFVNCLVFREIYLSFANNYETPYFLYLICKSPMKALQDTLKLLLIIFEIPYAESERQASKFKSYLKCRTWKIWGKFRALEIETSPQSTTFMSGKEKLFLEYKWLEIKHDGEPSLLNVKYSGPLDDPM